MKCSQLFLQAGGLLIAVACAIAFGYVAFTENDLYSTIWTVLLLIAVGKFILNIRVATRKLLHDERIVSQEVR